MFSAQWVALYTLLRKELIRGFSVWRQAYIPPIITSILYFVIFGKVIGSRVGPLHGVSYMTYIAPGLIMMQMIMASYSNTTFGFFIMKLHRNIEEILVSPMSNHVIILGMILAGVVRGLLIGILVAIVVECFTHVPIAHIFLLIVISLLTTILFALLGMINGIYARKFDDIAIIPNFVLTPLTYLGGVFYAIQSLPWFWQKVSGFNPILYAISAFRYSYIGVAGINVWISILCILILVFVLYVFAYRLLVKGVGMKH